MEDSRCSKHYAVTAEGLIHLLDLFTVEGFSHYAEANPASYKSKISSSQLLIIDIQASQELYCPDFSRIMSESPSFSDGEGSETTDLPAALEIESIATEEVQPTVLFPQRRTSLEKVTKTRKQYSEMIETALFQMNETRTGSSRQAILKYIRANYEVGDNASRYLSLAIAKLLEKGRIVRKSGVGGLGKFTLSKEIREAMRKGVKAKSKPKPKPKPKVAAKGTKPAKDNGKEKDAESKAKTGKSKTKAKKADEGDEESNKENKSKPKKTTNKNSAKATGGQAKKEETKAAKKTANEKKKAENVKGKGGDKAADKATKESKKTTGSKEKPKAKETKAGQSKAKGKAAAAKEKGNEKEADDDASKKPGQKNTRKNAEKNSKTKRKEL